MLTVIIVTACHLQHARCAPMGENNLWKLSAQITTPELNIGQFLLGANLEGLPRGKSVNGRHKAVAQIKAQPTSYPD
jgi:hypothetical protein